MKLLLTTDAVGGVATYSDDLTVALRQRGVEVFQAVLGPDSRPSSSHRINTGLPLDWLAARPDEVEHASSHLAMLAGELGVDLVQLHAPALAVAGKFTVAVLSVVHSCVSTWWSAVRQGPLPADLAWRADQTRHGLQASSLAIAPTRAFADAVRVAYGLEHALIAVYNGRPACEIPAAAEQAQSVLTVGRLWDEGKNIAALDEAAALIDVPVCAVGPLEGPNGATITPIHCDVAGRLSATGLRASYATRPIFVSPALYEPFGLAVLEAAQAGCALVLSDIPTFRELWGDAATFVNQSDPQEIAREVNALLNDPAERQFWGAKAQERAAAYSIDQTADAMLGHYRDMLADQKRRAA